MEYLGNSCFIRPLRFALLGIMLLTTSHAPAAETVAVISVKPSDQLMNDVGYLLNATGMQGLGQFVLPQVKAYFDGIDGTQPIGVVVTANETEFTPLGFLPVTDLDGFIGRLKEQIGEPIDAGDGVRELQGPQPLFVKEKSGWAFVAQTKEALAQLPEAPAKLLEGLDKNYVIGIRAHLKSVPEPYREMAISQISEGLERGLANSDDPNARQAADAQVAQLTQLINETDTLTIGWQIDSAQQRTYFDLLLQPTAGTAMAKQLDAVRDTKTAFGGFLVEDAGIRLNVSSLILPDQIEQATTSLNRVEQSTLQQLEKDGDIDNRTRAAAKQLVQTFFTIGRSTLKTGKFDSCTSVVLKPQALTLISGAHVANGDEVDTAVKQLVEMAKNASDFAFSRVQLNAEEHEGVRFHALDVPIPEDEYARKVLGETLNIVVGVAETSAYVALGTNGMEYLKQAISKSTTPQSAESFNLEVGLLPILKFAQSVEPNPMLDAMIQIVGASDGKDHIRVGTTVEEAGILYRFELEEGVLRVLGQAGQLVPFGF